MMTSAKLKALKTISLDQEKAGKLQDWMQKYQIKWVIQDSQEFPWKFSQTVRSPYIVYGMGNWDLLQSKVLWIVWPRAISHYADQVMEGLFQKLSSCHVVTVSGLARGVDQKCHVLSLQYGIPTIAILGGGLRYYLKRSEKKLISQIVEAGGLVLSEFPLDFQPTTWSFPQRNRIIAGLSDVVFVPEAKEGSGSLITVDFALQMKKEVMVAPNPLFSLNGWGTNQLIADKKVTMLHDFDQIISCFPLKTDKYLQTNLNESILTEQEKILLTLVQENTTREFSSWRSEFFTDFWVLLSELTILEMKGLIGQSSPGIYFVK